MIPKDPGDIESRSGPSPSALSEIFHEALASYPKTEARDRDRILNDLAADVAGAPRESLEALDRLHSPEHDRHEGYLVTYAHALFMTEAPDRALHLAEKLYSSGCRRGPLLDLLVRCLSEQDRHGEALTLLTDNEPVLAAYPALIKKLAALYFMTGDTEAASRTAGAIRSWCSDELLQTVTESNEVMDSYLLMTPEDRRVATKAEIDPYRDPAFQARAWLSYANEACQSTSRYQSSLLYLDNLIRSLIGISVNRAPGVDTVLTFGALFGLMESRLAQDFPALTVLGYDRSLISKGMNSQYFQAPNLHFLGGDFGPAVKPYVRDRRTLLFHGRTGTLMYPDELGNLYDTCRDIGIQRILLAEDVNFNLATGHFPNFAGSNRKSLLLGGHVMLHDYPHYLERSGYHVVSKKFRLYPLQFGTTINADSMVIEIIEADLEP